MWELALITLVVILLVLIFVIVACWISSNNCCRKNKRHIQLVEARLETGLATLQAAQTICCTKAFLNTVGGATVDRLAGLVKVVTWDQQPVNELPDGGWIPAFSTIDSSLIGWTVPLDGTYFVNYETLIATDVAAALLIVNGQVLLRSLSATVSSLGSGELVSQQLQKSFLVNLVKNDIVSVIIINFSGPGITPPLATGGPGRYLHTLTLDLRDANASSTDEGSDANPVPIILSTTSTTSKTDIKSSSTGEVAAKSIEVRSGAQNVEQWASAECVQQTLSNAATCQAAATSAQDKFNCLDSALHLLAACGLAT